jgi:hypothetical protein
LERHLAIIQLIFHCGAVSENRKSATQDIIEIYGKRQLPALIELCHVCLHVFPLDVGHELRLVEGPDVADAADEAKLGRRRIVDPAQ